MKHTTKLLTVLATVIAVFSLTGCPHPVNDNSDTHEHIWEETITKNPTCTNKGEKKLVCKICGEEEIEEIEKLPHSWVEDENHKCHYVCRNCGAKKVQHTFVCGGCDKCGTYEFNGEDDYQLKIEVYKTNVSKTVKTSKYWDDDKTKVDTVYFSFNKSTLSNYNEITVSEVYMGEKDENGEEIPTQEITVNLNDLILCKTSYNIIGISNVDNLKVIRKGINTSQVLVE